MSDSARVKVASFDDRVAAEIARGQLEAHGIDAWVEADDAGGAYPSLQLSRVRLLVNAEHAAAAADALLPAEPIEVPAPAADAATVEEPAAARRSPLGWLVPLALGAVVGFLAGERGSFSSRDAIDRNADGAVDSWTFYENDHAERVESDDDFDGAVDAWTRFEDGVVTGAEYDLDHNGVPDLFYEFRHGVPTSSVLRPNGGPAEREDRYVDGMLREELEVTPSGERRRIRVYDEMGRELPGG